MTLVPIKGKMDVKRRRMDGTTEVPTARSEDQEGGNKLNPKQTSDGQH